MTNLKLKDSNNNTKLTITSNFSSVDTLSFKKPHYIRNKPDDTCIIYFNNPIKKHYRRKLRCHKQSFKPKNEIGYITTFEHEYGLLKVTTEGKYYIEIDYVK